MKRARWRALSGIAGPVAFIAAWSFLGAHRAGYSPVEDPISRLAARGAPTAPVMTAGFLAFGAGVGVFSGELRRALPGGAGAALLATAAATVGIAALPLDAGFDGGHAVAAGLAYASLAATPLLGARALHAQGRSGEARASVVTGLAIAGALAASATSATRVGLLQRTGLTLGDAWIIVAAVRVLRRPATSS
jgi:hypothetical protein